MKNTTPKRYDVEGALSAYDLHLIDIQCPGQAVRIKATTHHGLQEWMLMRNPPDMDLKVLYPGHPTIILEQARW